MTAGPEGDAMVTAIRTILDAQHPAVRSIGRMYVGLMLVDAPGDGPDHARSEGL